MAMKPFAGYNFGDYWAHWLKVGAALKNPPRIFHVNWFRQDAVGKYLWPGFGENLRVLDWILNRCAGSAAAIDTPIGYMPRPDDLNTNGMDITPETLAELTAAPNAAWRQEIAGFRRYLLEFGPHLPGAILAEVDEIARRLTAG
jgi:phosphoenolpyruvate carboxykinase (GTP)